MQVVRIADEVSVNGVIENRQFENALIVGPAVLAPLEGAAITDCTFDATPSSLFIEVPGGRTVLGVVGLRNTSFTRCEFRSIGLIGTREMIETMREGFNLGAPPEVAVAEGPPVAPARPQRSSEGREL